MVLNTSAPSWGSHSKHKCRRKILAGSEDSRSAKQISLQCDSVIEPGIACHGVLEV